MSGPALVVLAAGLGSRFGGQKQFFGLGPSGEVLADYSLFDAWRAGFSKAVFVIRPGDEGVIEERFARRWKGRVAVETAPQRLEDLPGGLTPPAGRTKPWGTAHALWSARRVIDGPFASINADDFYGRPAFEAMARALAARPDEGALIGYALGETLSDHGSVARAVCRVGDDGLLRELVECRKIRRTARGLAAEDHPRVELRDDSPVSMNFWGFPAAAPALFETALRELSTDLARTKPVDKSSLLDAELALPEAIARLIDAGSIHVRVSNEGHGWIGVTYHDDVPAAAAKLRSLALQGEYPANLI